MGSLYMPVTEVAEDQKLGDVKFKSINLLKAALLELEFLKEVDQAGFLYERAHVHRAIYRYEKYWLPFLSSVSVQTSCNY